MNQIEKKIQDIQTNLKELNIQVDATKVMNRNDTKSILTTEPSVLMTQKQTSGSSKFASVQNVFGFLKSMYKILLAIPVIIFIILYVRKPKFVMKKDKKTGKTEFDKTKFKITFAILVFVCYALLYLYIRKFRKQS